MINFAICDDDLPATTEMEALVTDFFKGRPTPYHIDIFFDGETLWDSFRQSNGYDIIFLDIEMKTDGITAARKIRENGFNSLIIYVSSHTSYWKELFEVEPFRFIQKPIDPKLFHSYLSMAVGRILSGRQTYSFRFRQAFHSIPLKEILYFESRLHTALIHTRDGVFYQQKKLSEIELDLKNAWTPFLRIHQSFLVNLRHIQKMSFSAVTLRDGTVLKISENRQKSVQEQYLQMMEHL